MHRLRRGALYIAVLGGSLIVAMLSLAAIHVVRINLNRAASKPDRVKAALLADSAIEHALATLGNDPSWRTNLLASTNYPASPVSMNGGSFTWKLIDADGMLGNDSSDSVVVQGTATLGRITHVTEVTLQPSETGLSALEAALHCNNNITAGATVNIQTNTFIHSNANIAAYSIIGASVDGDAEAAGAIAGNITGAQSPGVTPRQMPEASVFDYYLKMGTPIDIAPMAHNDHYDLEEVVLSPNSNPWGPTNPEGIYVIDCEGGDLRVKYLRVFGTLCLLNPGPESRIESQVLIEPAISNFPSLLVDGSIGIKFNSEAVLWEYGQLNLNPPGTPYGGLEDNDQEDSYPSVIRGLVYVSGQMDFIADSKDSDFEGVVICGSIAANSDCKFTYQSTFLDYPPPGFGAGSQMQIIPGSWRRVPTP